MKRKTRYWFCEQCGNVYHRKMKDKGLRCRRCGNWCRKARKWPAQAQAKRERWKAKKEREWQRRFALRKKHSKVRTCFGYVLQISKETRAAWKKFLTAKQRRTFLSRGQAFLNALADDLWSCPHQRGRGERECDCSGGGLVGAPKLEIDDNLSNLGTYGRGFSRGRDGHEYKFRIRIRWTHEHRISTLLHEIVHWSDDLSTIDDDREIGGHTTAFFARMSDLAKRLNFTLEDGRIVD